MYDYGGLGFRGGDSECVVVRNVGKARGRKMEQLVSLRKSPSLSDASSDWRMVGSLRGRVRSLLLFPL